MIFGHFSEFSDFPDFLQNPHAHIEKLRDDIKNLVSRGFCNWKALLIRTRKLLVRPDAVELLNFEKSQILVKIHDFRSFS